jgi:hypothetical protein
MKWLILCNSGITDKGGTMKKDFTITAEITLIAHWKSGKEMTSAFVKC